MSTGPFLRSLNYGKPPSRSLPHEMRTPRENFSKVQKSKNNAVHMLVFAVHQSNLVSLHEQLIARSTPNNSLYQKWLTYDEVGDIVSNVVGGKAVVDWLSQANVTIVSVSTRMEYIKAEASISVWNALLGADFHEFEDLSRTAEQGKSEGWKPVHRTEKFYLPSHIEPHLHAVFHTTQVPAVLNKRQFQTNAGGQTSSGAVTVPFLKEYYKIPNKNISGYSQQAVFETDNAYYSPNDLTQFQLEYNLTVQDALHPYAFSANGCVHHNCYEGNLDIQYIMGIAQQAETIYWYTADTATGDPFVDWITSVANTTNPPLSNSISWGTPEQSLSAEVMEAFNTEAMKLAVMGVTVVVAAGNDGAAQGAEHCNIASGSSASSWTGSSSWTGKGYFPSFPATSPYATAVGATMGPETGSPEISCQSQLGGVITSGGGFSTYYPTPSWQADAVAQYFAALPSNQRPIEGYNGNGRAYPDISLIGVKYQTMIDGVLEPLYGTSAAAPVFAAMISLLNAERAAQNKPSLGFLNPTLYMLGMPNGYGIDDPFHDVTSGHNKCTVYSGTNPSDAICCDSGFHAAAGWDPVTGWGGVSYPTLERMFTMKLNTTAEVQTGPGSSGGGLSQWSLVAIFASGVIGAGLFYYWLTRYYCKKNSDDPVPAVAVAAPASVEYQQIEPLVIQPDEECVAVEVEVVGV